MAYNTNLNPGTPPLLWGSVKDAFDQINENFEILAATIGDGSGIVPLSFEDINSNLIPADNATYDLGSAVKRWKTLYLSSDGFSMGSVAIQTTIDGTAVALPSGSTVGGKLIRNPDESAFRNIAVSGQSTVTSDDFTDTVTFVEGTGITITTNATTDAIEFINSGVTKITAGTAVTISPVSGLGDVTINNDGVTDITNSSSLPSGRSAGVGIAADTTTGSVTLTNTGILNVQGDGTYTNVTVNAATGVATVFNLAPATNVYRTIEVQGTVQTLTAGNATSTLRIIEGTGIQIVPNPQSFSDPDRLTFINTGVTSITGTGGITVSANTGDIAIGFNGVIDVKGNIFGEDSSLLVDAFNNRFFGTFDGHLVGTAEADLTGSVFSSNSTMLVDGVDGKIVGPIEIGIADLTIQGGSSGQILSTDGNGNHTWIDMTGGGGSIVSDPYIFKVAAEDSAERIINSGETVKFVGANSVSVSSDAEGLMTITGPDLGTFTFTGSVLDTNDSSTISITPAAIFNSDVTVENDLIVDNEIRVARITAEEITSNGTGFSEIVSETNLDLTAGNAVVVTSSPLRLAQFTTTERDLLTAQNGDLIYNTTVNKIQGYQNGGWINIDDGSSA